MGFIKKFIPLAAGVVASIFAEDAVSKMLDKFSKKEDSDEEEPEAEEEKTEETYII